MVKTKAKLRLRLQYTEDQLKKAVEEIKSGKSISSVGRKYKIAKTTLSYKSKEVNPRIKKGGPSTVLTSNEETQLVLWMIRMSKNGFLVTKNHLLASVKVLSKGLRRSTPFTNGIPGRSWLNGFFNRHPELTQRISKNVTISRTPATEEGIRGWFSRVSKYLGEKNLSDIDGSRIFSCGVSAFLVCPKSGNILLKKGEKWMYTFVNNDGKERLPILFIGNAVGTLAPPLILFACKKILPRIAKSIPGSWGFGRIEEWMTGERFYEYITNIFYPWLLENKTPFPIILYIDGNSAHLTMSVSHFCSTNGIILVPLYPNGNHVLQPLNMAFARPLKSAWQKTTLEWRIENNGQNLKKENHVPHLKQAMDMIDLTDIILNQFNDTGLYPLSPDAIDYSKLQQKNVDTDDTDSMQEDIEPSMIESSNELEPEIVEPTSLLSSLEKYIDPKTLNKFKEVAKSGVWTADLENKNLFFVWNSIRESNSE